MLLFPAPAGHGTTAYIRQGLLCYKGYVYKFVARPVVHDYHHGALAAGHWTLVWNGIKKLNRLKNIHLLRGVLE